MRVNVDCIRDILLCIEEHTVPQTRCYFYKDDSSPEIKPYQVMLLDKYSNEELIYHVQYCLNTDLISQFEETRKDDVIRIVDLTLQGHEFVANIRSTENWNKTKDICNKVGASGFKNAFDFSKEVVALAAKQLLGTR